MMSLEEARRAGGETEDFEYISDMNSYLFECCMPL